MYFFLLLAIVVATISYMVSRKLRVQENKTLASSSSSSSSSSSCSSSSSPFSGSFTSNRHTTDFNQIATEVKETRIQENKTLASSSSTPSRNWEHDVFVSFRGEDVRSSFLSHILKDFKRKGINPFMDDEMKKGASISPELIRAIEGSKIAIVLLSKNYASSSWCLNELVKIIGCRRNINQEVITIFYQVEPTDVRKQAGEFGKVFKETCKGKTPDVVDKWREALTEVGSILGYDSTKWANEASAIEEVANNISQKLNHLAPSHNWDHLIGMETHMKEMQLLLELDLEDEVRMIGIWGPPGIGKSTICRYLHDQLSSNHFQMTALMVNIKQRYPNPCLDEGSAQLQLQKDMLSLMFDQKNILITHLGTAQNRLKDKKVLLVLDDVDQHAQLVALAEDNHWFGPGSRIIIVTEDLRVLSAHGIKMDRIYKVNYPSYDEALQMFCMYAFRRKFPDDGFTELAREVTYLVGNLPLGLQVMGSYFLRRPKHEWIKALRKLRSRLDGKIESILKFSYDALYDDEYKALFLYIACFFHWCEVEKVEACLAESFRDVREGLRVLAEKSLIYVEDEFIQMHNLLTQLGQEIVRKQFGKCQILVREYNCEVLVDNTAVTKIVVGIDYECHEGKELTISERAFEKTSNLRFLRILNSCESTFTLPSYGCVINIPSKLRLLNWDRSPVTCWPTTMKLEFLVELNMRYSKLEKLWEGIIPLPRLQWMDLSFSENLRELPNLSTATSLKELNLIYCSSLVELPSSIGNAINLQTLDLRYCLSLVELPSSIGNATKLQFLHLSHCSSLVELPSSIGNATNLQILYLSHCSSLVELPSSIGNATNLQKVYLNNCSNLVELPSSIGNATNLQKLYLNYCSSLVELPSSIGNATNLQKLYLNYCSSLVELPSSIGNATNLQQLHLSNCSNLVELPSSIGNATNLRKLDLRHCSSLVEFPSSIGNATNLQKLDLIYCSSLVEFPFSIGNATNLQKLDLSYCSSLVELPSSIGIATNLQDLNLRYCSSLVKIPSSIGNATNLQNLNLDSCSSLVELPFSIGNATNLQNLDLRHCSSLVELPSSIANATNLKVLDLSYCSSLVELPSSIGNATNLKDLNLSYCSSLAELPSSIGNATNLYTLNLCHCSSLVELPSSIGNATNLNVLNLSYCSSLVELPSSIGNATNLKDLNLSYCSSLAELPSSIGNATNLYTLNLCHCSSLVELPSSIGNATNLKVLDLSYCSSLVELPSSIGNATNLQTLDLSYCSSLVELPSSIGNATSLTFLYLSHCSSLVELSSSIGNATNIKSLNLSHCLSLVEIPSSIGKLHTLERLLLRGCSKLRFLPTNINMEQLLFLDISDCLLLKTFPGISTNIKYLNLKGTAVKEVPSSIRSWSNLDDLCMSYSERLLEMPAALDTITELDLTDLEEIQELGIGIKGFTRLNKLVLNGMRKLVSLPQLSDSLEYLEAENCESLERLDCSFCNPRIELNFRNCFKLNQEARDLIIQTSTHGEVILPGREVPTYFNYRASGNSLTVKLNENEPLGTSRIYRACVLLVNDDGDWGHVSISFSVASKYTSTTTFYRSYKGSKEETSLENLFIFNIEVRKEEVTSTEFVLEFCVEDPIFSKSCDLEIKECGVVQF